MDGLEIKKYIKELLSDDFGFDIYISMKDGSEKIKQLMTSEEKLGGDLAIKDKLKMAISDAIQDKFLTDEIEYVNAKRLADNQNVMYVIEQNDQYRPFDFRDGNSESDESFKASEKDNADGILFKFSILRSGPNATKELWAYQKIWPVSIPNKKKTGLQIIAGSKDDVFEEMKNQMFIIKEDIDLIIVNDHIVTNNIKLLENHFKFEKFIRESAKSVADNISKTGLVKNTEKIYEYIERKDKRYAKKLMQIPDYPVLGKDNIEIMDKLNTVDRWKEEFEISKNSIILNSYKDVEKLIDLYIERYTRSDVTGVEYDTSVKNRVEH